jgi:hypothetical protein
MLSMRRLQVIAIAILIAAHFGPATTVTAQSGTLYVRAGATGAGTGADWTNAYSTLPASLTRGATYYVAAGTYGGYTFNGAASGTTPITVRKATIADHGSSTGWLDSYGQGAATLSSLDFSTKYVNVYDLTIANGTNVGSVSAGPAATTFINLHNLTTKYLFVVAQDVLFAGGSFGGFDPCASTSVPEDIVQIWDDGVSTASSRITFDGARIHDETDHGTICAGLPGAGRHVDCMQLLGGHFITVRNSHFYNCATSDILAQGLRDTLSDVTIENNFFQSVQNPGASLNFAGGDGKIGGTNVIRYNVIMGTSQFNLSSNAITIIGNVLNVGGSCGSSGIFSYNVFLPGSATCGTHVFTGTPSFVGPTPSPLYLNGIIPDYHLNPTDTVAKDRGNPAAGTYPATDIDGNFRFIGSAPDIGAHEVQGGATPPAPPSNLRVIP